MAQLKTICFNISLDTVIHGKVKLAAGISDVKRHELCFTSFLADGLFSTELKSRSGRMFVVVGVHIVPQTVQRHEVCSVIYDTVQ